MIQADSLTVCYLVNLAEFLQILEAIARQIAFVLALCRLLLRCLSCLLSDLPAAFELVSELLQPRPRLGGSLL
jgi:hypothetical protein